MIQKNLDSSNYTKGFLFDHEYMAGVAEDPDQAGQFLAFLISQETGDCAEVHSFSTLEGALSSINQMQKDWIFVAAGGCGGCGTGKCSEGACAQGGCGQGQCGETAAPDTPQKGAP